MEPLVEFVNSAGFTDEYSHVFLGTELTEVERDVQGVEEENLTIERIHLDDVPAMIADHRLLDVKSILGLTSLISDSVPAVSEEFGSADLPLDVEDFLTWLVAERGRSRNTLVAYRRDSLGVLQLDRRAGSIDRRRQSR